MMPNPQSVQSDNCTPPAMANSVQNLCAEVLPIWASQIQAARQLAGTSIDMMSHQFASLSHLIQTIAQANPASQQTLYQNLQQEIDQVLVSLQFQDRVSQMLHHIEDDMLKLQATIANHTPIEASVWLKEYAETYTMQEQHDIHQACLTKEPSTFSTKKAREDPDEITFF